MVDGGDNDDDGGVSIGKEPMIRGNFELPTGSAEAFGTVTDVSWTRVGSRSAFCCDDVAAVISVVVVVGAAVVIWRVASWCCNPCTIEMLVALVVASKNT